MNHCPFCGGNLEYDENHPDELPSCDCCDFETVLKKSVRTELSPLDEVGECPSCSCEMVNSSFAFTKIDSDFKCKQCNKEYKVVEIFGDRLIEIHL